MMWLQKAMLRRRFRSAGELVSASNSDQTKTLSLPYPRIRGIVPALMSFPNTSRKGQLSGAHCPTRSANRGTTTTTIRRLRAATNNAMVPMMGGWLDRDSRVDRLVSGWKNDRGRVIWDRTL